MSISTYSELQTAVASWLNRTDLSSVIPDFIALAGSDIRNDVSVQAMESLATGSLTGETLAHPARLTEVRRLVVADTPRDYVTPDEYQRLQKAQSQSKVYTSIGQSLYILNGTSGDAYSLLSRAAFAPFSAGSDTNWLLTNAPDVYLFAACKHGAVYLKDAQDEARFTALYNAAAGRVSAQEKRAGHGAPLRVRPA